MADRTLSVNLTANIQGYVRGMDEVARKTREASQTVEQKLAEQRKAFEQVGAAGLAVGALAAAGVAAAVAAYADFDQAMSNVQAATHETTENMELLRDAALEAGASTVFSATESAAAIEELAKAGISTADILDGGLTGALDLAAAGGIAVADAAEIAASAMTQFQLSGSDVVHVADLLAAGAGKAQGGVQEMSDALNQSGLVASQMGIDLEETVGSLTAFASAGLIGSDAGTSFRAMLLRLANPTGESAELMDELGLSFYNAQGDFIGMEGVAEQLTTQLADLTQEQRNAALAQIFGQDAIRAASILYEQGADGVADWTAAVNDAGYAAETAATRLDNLAGDFEAFQGALETALIGVGESGDGPLRELLRGVTALIEGFTELPGPVQQSVGVLGGVVAVVGLVGGGALVAVPQIVAFQGALSTLGITAASTQASLAGMAAFLTNPAVLGIVAAVAGLGALANAIESTRPQMDAYVASMESGANAAELLRISNEGLANSFDGFEFDTTNVGSYLDQIDRIRESNGWASLLPENYEVQFTDFSSRIRQIDGALSQMSPEDARAGFDALVDGLGLTSDQADQLRGQMTLTAGVLEDADEAADVAATGIAAVGDAAETSADQTSALLDAQQELIDAYFATTDATAAYEQAIDDIDEAFAAAAENGESLAAAWDATRGTFDLGSESGRYAAESLQALVEASNANIESMRENGATTDELRAAQESARDEVERLAGRFDATGQAAETYTGLLNEIPENVLTQIDVDTAAAEAALSRLARDRTARVIASVVSDGQATGFGSQAYRGAAVARAGGGIIPGPPSDRDNILAHLATGEFVVNARQTSQHRQLLEAINAGRLPAYATGGYVQSGYMQSQPVPVAAPVVTSGPNVQVSVQPAPGMSERAIGEAAASAIAWSFR